MRVGCQVLRCMSLPLFPLRLPPLESSTLQLLIARASLISACFIIFSFKSSFLLLLLFVQILSPVIFLVIGAGRLLSETTTTQDQTTKTPINSLILTKTLAERVWPSISKRKKRSLGREIRLCLVGLAVDDFVSKPKRILILTINISKSIYLKKRPSKSIPR